MQQTWGDGSELVLDGDNESLSRRIARPPDERAEVPPMRAPAGSSTAVARPRAEIPRAGAPGPPSRSAAASRDFARPAWCPDARFPHQRLVGTDAELADRDLRLASL